MKLSQTETQELLQRLIFDDGDPEEWVQDVWGLSPILGETAAKLFQVYERLLDCSPEDTQAELLKRLYADQLD
jgi:hypothetical protein